MISSHQMPAGIEKETQEQKLDVTKAAAAAIAQEASNEEPAEKSISIGNMSAEVLDQQE